MKIGSWFRGLIDNKPVSLSLPKGTPQVNREANILEIAKRLGMEQEGKQLAAIPDAARTEEQKSLLLRLLEASERNLGKDHVSTGIILKHLGMTQLGLATAAGRLDYIEAEMTWTRSLGILEKELGPANPNTTLVRYFLGFLYMQSKRHGKSIELHERNLSILDTSVGETFPQIDQLL